MPEDGAECPNCGEAVQPGETLCGHCGLNLVSGESYEERLKRARGRDKTAEEGTSIGGIALAFTFGLIILAGFLYHRRTLKVFRQDSDTFEGYLERVDEVRTEAQALSDPQTSAGSPDDVRRKGEELIEDLESDAEDIEVDSSSGTGSDEEGSLKKARKSLLRNLVEKTRFHMSRLEEE
ncbi:MAG: zinc ribbon domain-containing protein [Planctomycetota bacterium]